MYSNNEAVDESLKKPVLLKAGAKNYRHQQKIIPKSGNLKTRAFTPAGNTNRYNYQRVSTKQHIITSVN
jgi:hypothetical protein